MCDDAQLPSAPWRPLSGSCYAKYWKYTHLLFRFLFHRRVVVAAATFTGTQPSALAFSGWWVVQGDGWWIILGGSMVVPQIPLTIWSLLCVRLSCLCFVSLRWQIFGLPAPAGKSILQMHTKSIYIHLLAQVEVEEVAAKN